MHRREMVLGTLALLGLPAIRAKANRGELDFYLGVYEGMEPSKDAAIARLSEHVGPSSPYVGQLRKAPETRIFFVDCGSMPKAKAERHIREMMARHKAGSVTANANRILGVVA